MILFFRLKKIRFAPYMDPPSNLLFGGGGKAPIEYRRHISWLPNLFVVLFLFISFSEFKNQIWRGGEAQFEYTFHIWIWINFLVPFEFGPFFRFQKFTVTPLLQGGVNKKLSRGRRDPGYNLAVNIFTVKRAYNFLYFFQ